MKKHRMETLEWVSLIVFAFALACLLGAAFSCTRLRGAVRPPLTVQT